MTRRIRQVHIAHLVLPAGALGRARISEAVRREVAAIAGRGAVADASSASPQHVRAESSATADARTLGRDVAAAVAPHLGKT